MEHEEFLLLPLPQLIDIISSDELNVRSEEQVFQAVMNWIKYNMSERRGHLAHVLQVSINQSEHSILLTNDIAACEDASAESQVPGWNCWK